MPDRLRLPLTFDAGRLRRDLDRLGSADWIAHFVKQNYDGDWSAAPLRAAAGASHPVMMVYSDPTATAFEDTPLLAHCPYFREVLAAIGSELRSVRLMRLTPGSVIKEHRDYDLDAESGSVRIHIPITTNPGVEITLNGTRVVMEPGSVWYLRLSDPHRVANRGATDRVHMVVDAVADGWMKAMLERAAGEQTLPLGEAAL
ncbi:MAG: aspartyl/asparaginyl beta-hydroxylase domain-containing protein [Propylenella sp.]